MDEQQEQQLRAETDRGMEFYRAGDYEQAYPIFLAAAEQGLARAQRSCGVMHGLGQGMPADDAQALAWYEKAAAQDDARALYLYDCMLRDGRGTEADPEKARALYERAMERGAQLAAQGDPEDQRWYGGRFLEPFTADMAPDYQQALYWMEQAAAQGDAGAAEAMTLCGLLYRADGTKEGRARSIQWLHRGAEQGSAFGQFLYGVAQIVGDGVRADPAAGIAQIIKIETSPSHPASGQAGAAFVSAWEPLAQRGDKLIQALVAFLCFDQRVGKPERAKYWCLQLKKQGVRIAKLALKVLDVMEKRDQPNLRNGLRAIGVLKALAKLGIADMQYQYGKFLDDMPLVHVQRKARKWYKKAAKQGHGLAQYALACHYWSDGTRHSEKKCIQWLKKAAENGSETAKEDLQSRYHITV